MNFRLFSAITIQLLLSGFVCVAAQNFEPGEVYFGRNGYIEYLPGDLPIVFAAPHGGSLTPDEIPDRTYGTTVTDSNTRETVMAFRAAFYDATGHYPHVVISNLKRTKLDPNREIVEAAQGDPRAELAWTEFHRFIDSAKGAITSQHGKGIFVDLHGHGHTLQRLELGYLLSAANLSASNDRLDEGLLLNFTSIKRLGNSSQYNFSELIRGPASLGTLFAVRGIPAVPSEFQPGPGPGNPYFSGGYSTRRHGSIDSGSVDGVQLESHWTGLRDTAQNRARYAKIVVEVFGSFFLTHYGWSGISTHKESVRRAGIVEEPFNFPNPFSGTTTISYSVPSSGTVSITIYDLLGREVAIIENEFKAAGAHEVMWDSSTLAPGLYLYSVVSRSGVRQTGRLFVQRQ